MITYNLYNILKKELKNGSNDLVTRPSGQIIRIHLEKAIEKEKDGEVIALDFSNIGIIDYSCADEVIAKLISRLLSGEYGDKYIILIGLNDTHKENIEVALERKDLSMIGQMNNGKKILLGNLNNYLRETLEFIFKKGKITASDLSKSLKIPANTSGTRLLNLHKKRLVKRTEKIKNGGRVWIYERL